MNSHRCLYLRLALTLLIPAMLPGCVGNRPYRLQGIADEIYEKKFPGQKPPNEVGEAGDRHYHLSFVEFDEKGDFWDRAQLAKAAVRIRNSPRPVLLVVFIHGWHHNAADRSENTKNPGDVQTFRCLLSQLAVSASAHDLDVHGVYLGWRGRLFQGPLDYVTFLDRKGAAARVAGTPVTETIFELIRQARKRSATASKTVVVGHSFGALVLEKAMAQAIAGSVLAQDTQARGGTFNAPADLILLVNSAAESIYAKELDDMFRAIRHRGQINSDRPLLVSLTSVSDTATKGWFPVGAFPPNLFARRHYDWGERRGPSSDNVSQHEYLTTTPGHNQRLFTHEIVRLGSDPKATTSTPFDIRQPGACVRANPAFEENLQNPQGMMFATSVRANPEQLVWWRIRPLSTDKRNLTPYWVMQVPDEIIHEHSPIFTPEGRALMAAIFRITNPKSQPGPRQMSISSE
jgi:hypothetical protein